MRLAPFGEAGREIPVLVDDTRFLDLRSGTRTAALGARPGVKEGNA